MGRAAGSVDPVLRVRAAELGDASDVARLLGDLGYPSTRDEAAERISIVRHDPRQHLLLAEMDGQVCGLIATYTRFAFSRGAEVTQITAIVVSPACHRQGIGRRLLREVEARARRAGVTCLDITSNARREEAHAFYRSCGYSDSSLRFVKMLGD
jgi:ribosomal protein S18 acetylase RimI-like enzyme